MCTLYKVCLRSIGTVHTAQTTFIAEKKSIAFYDVTMSYGFENQISASVTTTFFFARFSVEALSL